MAFTLRQLAASIQKDAGWDLPPLPLVWSPRMARCAGLFVIEKDARGVWRPEIRLSIPLLRRLDWPWPIQVCGCNCWEPEAVTRRILEHELIHYKLARCLSILFSVNSEPDSRRGTVIGTGANPMPVTS